MSAQQSGEMNKARLKGILLGLALVVSFFILCVLTFTLSGPVADGLTRSAAQSRCAPASAQLTDKLKAGLKVTKPGNEIQKVFIVKSKDFADVYMVAANITGAGIKPGEVIGVWAFSGDPGNPGEIMSVDGFAKNYSNFPDAAAAKDAIAVSNDGASDAFLCVQSALK